MAEAAAGQNMGLEGVGGKETQSCDAERGAGLSISCSMGRDPGSFLCCDKDNQLGLGQDFQLFPQ